MFADETTAFAAFEQAEDAAFKRFEQEERDSFEAFEQEEEDAFAPRTEQVVREIVVRDNNGGLFLKRFKRLVQACARHGQTLEILRSYDVEVPHPHFLGRKALRRAHSVSFPPVVGERGQVIGHFERAEDGKSWYLHTFGPVDAVRAFIGRESTCDHCGLNRARNNTFVVRTAEGDKIVARQCLLAYTGIDPLAALAAAAAYSKLNGEGDEDERSGGSAQGSINVLDAIQRAYRVARKLGGYSKEHSRAHYNLIFRGKPDPHASHRTQLEEQVILDGYEGFDPPCDIDALRDYVDGVDGEFGQNLQLVFSFEEADPKRLGLIIAGVGLSVGRVLQREKDEALKASLPPAKHLDAEVGKRIDLVGQVVRTYIFDGQYGPTCIISIRCDDGSSLVNFHTGADRPEAGQRYTIRATVKRHETDKRSGDPVTSINRAVYTPVDAAQPDLV